MSVRKGEGKRQVGKKKEKKKERFMLLKIFLKYYF